MPVLDASHDFAHEVEGDSAWSESYYFNAYDPAVDAGIFTRIGVRPNEGTMDVGLSVWLPGDRIAYRGKRLSVNGTDVEVKGSGYYTDAELNFLRLPTFSEKLGERNHQMMIVPAQPPVDLAQVRQFAHRSNCEYNDDGFACTVPAGHYFMMGDNRDQSSDSRYWGFVPDDHIKGRAFLVWMNFNDFKRIGSGIE